MPSLSTILAGFLAAALLAAGLLWWRYDAALTREAEAKAALATALEANASLIAEAKRLKETAAAEAERAIARQRERDGMAAQMVELRQALGDGNDCVWTPERAQAVDKFLRGQ